MAEQQPVPQSTSIFLEPQYLPQVEPAPAKPSGSQPAKDGRKRKAAIKDDQVAQLAKQRAKLLARIGYKKQYGDSAGAAVLVGRVAQLEQQIRELTPTDSSTAPHRVDPPEGTSYTYCGPTGPRRAHFRTGRGI